MIKLKLTKDHLFALCGFLNPQKFEYEATEFLRINELQIASYCFDLMAVGDIAAKLYVKVYVFGEGKKASVKITASQACSILSHFLSMESYPLDEFKRHVLTVLKNDINLQLTNYQKRYTCNQIPQLQR